MRRQGYGRKYLNRDEVIHLVAIVFGVDERDLLGIRVEPLTCDRD
ncbi:MAG: hypothetical protein OXC62_09620 [Aestuariivita sp.]|nr:hypothetical protein [Aestuariivita sp.]